MVSNMKQKKDDSIYQTLVFLNKKRFEILLFGYVVLAFGYLFLFLAYIWS